MWDVAGDEGFGTIFHITKEQIDSSKRLNEHRAWKLLVNSDELNEEFLVRKVTLCKGKYITTKLLFDLLDCMQWGYPVSDAEITRKIFTITQDKIHNFKHFPGTWDDAIFVIDENNICWFGKDYFVSQVKDGDKLFINDIFEIEFVK